MNYIYNPNDGEKEVPKKTEKEELLFNIGNTNSIVGTVSETLLLAKSWTIIS